MDDTTTHPNPALNPARPPAPACEQVLPAELLARQSAAWRQVITQLGLLNQARHDGSTEQIRHARHTLAALYAHAEHITTPPPTNRGRGVSPGNTEPAEPAPR